MKSVSFGRSRGTRRGSNWPETLAFQCKCARLPKPEFEYRFHARRRWRFDLAFVDAKLAVEVDGGTFVNGRHSRGTGVEKDCEKFAEAMKLGWQVLRVTPRQVARGIALGWIDAILTARELYKQGNAQRVWTELSVITGCSSHDGSIELDQVRLTYELYREAERRLREIRRQVEQRRDNTSHLAMERHSELQWVLALLDTGAGNK